jgi:hypothetical protein
MNRFVERQVPVALQPMRMLADHVVHTSVRPVVREKLLVEHRLLSGPAPSRALKAESIAVESRIVTPREIQTPAATPVRVPDVNIAHIADQVMRQLDHRISAWRERRGRA